VQEYISLDWTKSAGYTTGDADQDYAPSSDSDAQHSTDHARVRFSCYRYRSFVCFCCSFPCLSRPSLLCPFNTTKLFPLFFVFSCHPDNPCPIAKVSGGNVREQQMHSPREMARRAALLRLSKEEQDEVDGCGSATHRHGERGSTAATAAAPETPLETAPATSVNTPTMPEPVSRMAVDDHYHHHHDHHQSTLPAEPTDKLNTDMMAVDADNALQRIYESLHGGDEAERRRTAVVLHNAAVAEMETRGKDPYTYRPRRGLRIGSDYQAVIPDLQIGVAPPEPLRETRIVLPDLQPPPPQKSKGEENAPTLAVAGPAATDGGKSAGEPQTQIADTSSKDSSAAAPSLSLVCECVWVRVCMYCSGQ
jgi:hypothetical protein